MHVTVDRFPDERLSWGLWLGIIGGISWSWIRYTVAYGLVFAAGTMGVEPLRLFSAAYPA